jgi:hypothetical protein
VEHLAKARIGIAAVNAKPQYFSFEERRREKQRCREADVRAIRGGEVSASDVSGRNDFFAALDVQNYRLIAIGPRAISNR